MTRKKGIYKEIKELNISTEIRIRFNETDPLGIVWHGHYITYFEEGREAFGMAHGISYIDINNQGYSTPIIKTVCEHRTPLSYGEKARIETTFVHTPAAKMVFRYKIYTTNGDLACFGETIQVFVNSEGNLALYKPDFFEKWWQKMKNKYHIEELS